MDPLRDAVCVVAGLPSSAEEAAVRTALAEALADPEALEEVAEELLRRVDFAGRGFARVRDFMAVVERARANLKLDALEGEELYLACTTYDNSGCNQLSSEAIAPALLDLFAQCTPAETRDAPSCTRPQPPRTPRRASTPPAPPSSPALPGLRVTLQTLGGDSCEVQVPPDATGEELKLAFARTPLCALRQPCGFGAVLGRHRLVLDARVLRDGVRLEDQGVAAGCVVNVLRVSPPPTLVQLKHEGYGCGPSIRGSCGTFRLAESAKSRSGRPVYVRDEGLSRWNAAMLYHGSGNRFLRYEEHPEHGGRWTLTDDKEWDGYGDRSYAFVVSDAPHPGCLEGCVWRVYRDAKSWEQREWVEHDSLRLVPEADAA